MSKVNHYDVVVLGLGGMGSAALYQLAKRGISACGIEQHHVAHDLGSSHGEVRVIRKAYHEHPDYVPLLHRAYDLWAETEAEAGQSLMTACGLVLAGAPDSETIRGLDECYARHDLPRERLDRASLRERVPQMHVPEDFEAFFDPIGGYLRIERCVQAHLKLAGDHGAEIRLHERAISWTADTGGVSVATDKGELRASALIITMGPWAREVLLELGIQSKVLRKVQLWYDSPNIERFREGELPIFLVERDYGIFYGFPSIDDAGLKVAEHSGGEIVDVPDTVDRSLRETDEAPVLRFLGDTFPELRPVLRRFSVCMYTMTPDAHFVLDTHPEYSNVVIGAGFSGHGFKFASVVGEVLADLALEGQTRNPIGFLRLDRFNGVKS